MRSHADVEIVDLSIGIEPGIESEPTPASLDRYDHGAGATQLADTLQEMGSDVTQSDFPDGMGLAWEEVHAITHTGTHLDAPWHYGPTVDGDPARTIEDVPLEWCCGDATVLDVSWMAPGTEIGPDHVDDALDDRGYDRAPTDIVLLQTGADELWGDPAYLTDFPGMGRAATTHLVEQGVRVIGTDAYGFDKPFDEMGRRFDETGDPAELWPAHFAGREVEYCQIEKMANLGELPRPTDVPMVTTPIVIPGASAGWVRPVALFDEAG